MAVLTTFQSMGIRSENAVSAHLLLENAHESNLVSDISRSTIWQAIWAARTCAPSPAFRRLSTTSTTTSMPLPICAARTACSIEGTYLAQPEKTALRRTPLRGYPPLFPILLPVLSIIIYNIICH